MVFFNQVFTGTAFGFLLGINIAIFNINIYQVNNTSIEILFSILEGSITWTLFGFLTGIFFGIINTK